MLILLPVSGLVAVALLPRPALAIFFSRPLTAPKKAQNKTIFSQPLPTPKTLDFPRKPAIFRISDCARLVPDCLRLVSDWSKTVKICQKLATFGAHPLPAG